MLHGVTPYRMFFCPMSPCVSPDERPSLPVVPVGSPRRYVMKKALVLIVAASVLSLLLLLLLLLLPGRPYAVSARSRQPTPTPTSTAPTPTPT
jgi:hypothetical protein